MIGFNSSLRGVRFAAMVCVSIAAACSSDDNHGPTIGAPTTTVPIVEGGGTPSIGGTSNPSTGGDTSFAGTFAAGGIGTGPGPGFGTGGTFGVAGTVGVGTNPFGTAGTFNEPFGGAAGTIGF